MCCNAAINAGLLTMHVWRLGSPGTESQALRLCSTQLSMKFIMLINVKMPTIVGILTFISLIDTKFESLKSRNVFITIFQHFSFHKQFKFHAQLSRT